MNSGSSFSFKYLKTNSKYLSLNYIRHMLPSFCIIIPARYASTRFPGKPLADIDGKSMIRRVYDAARSVGGADDVFVATDDVRIQEHASAFAKVIMTSTEHPSGTDRCAEALALAGVSCDVVVNLQGDEPFIKPSQVRDLVKLFADTNIQIATLKKELFDAEEIENPNVVKVVTDIHDKALYFSRSRIPYQRDNALLPKYFKHLGMYAYRTETLMEITQLAPGTLENIEKLEQLRWLENGYHIAVAETHWQSPAVDTPEDVEKALAFLKQGL
jgi:3-deoxy-manno-octulosonate cytidylyltransferase (CMP-KDO synthetase)